MNTFDIFLLNLVIVQVYGVVLYGVGRQIDLPMYYIEYMYKCMHHKDTSYSSS